MPALSISVDTTGKTKIMGETRGKPVIFLGIEFAPLSIPFERRLQTLAVFIYMFMFVFGAVVLTALSVYLIIYSDNWKWVPLLYFAFYFYDIESGETGGRESV